MAIILEDQLSDLFNKKVDSFHQDLDNIRRSWSADRAEPVLEHL
jgi:hypothetical protein